MLGQWWPAFISIVFTPYYIAKLGASGYAWIGISGLMLAGVGIFDSGLNSLTSRKLAGFEGNPFSRKVIASFLHACELIMLLASTSLTLLCIFPLRFVFASWAQVPGDLFIKNSDLLILSLLLACLVISTSICNFYKSCLLGLQRQITLNSILSISAAIKSFGCVSILFFSSSVILFLAWQAFVALAASAVMLLSTYKALGLRFWVYRSFAFHQSLDANDIRFATSLVSTSLASFVVLQSDKLAVATLLGPINFGYYSFVATMASAVSYLAMPIVNVAYPQLCEFSLTNMGQSFKEAFHRSSRLVTCLLAPVTFTALMLSSYLFGAIPSLQNLGDSGFVRVFMVLISASAILCLQLILVNAQKANGHTKYWLIFSIISAFFYLPCQIYFTSRFAIYGASLTWFAYSLISLLIACPYLFFGSLRGERFKWFVHDLLKPSLLAAVGALITYIICYRQINLSLPSMLLTLTLMLFVSASSSFLGSFKLAKKNSSGREQTWRWQIDLI